jgi:CHAD domain-containing protein
MATRVTPDRSARIAAAGAIAAGAAVAGGRVAIRRLSSDEGDDGPSRKYRLRRKEAPSDGVRRIALGRSESALEHLRGDRSEANTAEAVHEARKDLKKLRSALRLVRDELGEETYRLENTRFRDAGRLLAGARDAEVKLQTLESLSERYEDEFPDEGLGPLRDALESERSAATEEIEADGDGAPRVRAALEVQAGEAAAQDWPLDADDWSLVAPGLKRSYRRGRNRFAETRAQADAENVHEWRKRVKDLWYHLRILRNAWPEVVGESADQAHELADLLGDHHDLAVLEQDLTPRGGLVAGKDADALRGLIHERQAELLDHAVTLGERVYAEKPKAFLRRFEAYWDAWRSTSAGVG